MMQFEERRSVRSAFAGTAGGFVSAAITAPPGTTAPTDTPEAPRRREALKIEAATRSTTRI